MKEKTIQAKVMMFPVGDSKASKTLPLVDRVVPSYSSKINDNAEANHSFDFTENNVTKSNRVSLKERFEEIYPKVFGLNILQKRSLGLQVN